MLYFNGIVYQSLMPALPPIIPPAAAPTDWGAISINVGCSLTASLVFLFIVLLLFKPKIKISPFIAQLPISFAGEGTAYCIKIVNRSIFIAYDIKAELYVVEKYTTPPSGMINTRSRPLTLVLNQLSSLDRRLPLWIRKEANHCVIFRSLDDLSTILADDRKSVEFRIILRHGLTGLSRVFKQEYSDVTEIKLGKFSYGPKFGTLN